MRDIIINLQKSNTRKIQLKIASIFISPKGVDEERVMHSNSDNTEFCYMIIQTKLLINISSHCFQDTKLVEEHQREEAFSFLIHSTLVLQKLQNRL